jgi:hypothetical protein
MPFPEILKPHPAKLEEHYILGEIIDHIEELHDELHDAYSFIDFNILRSQLINVRNHNVDPSTLLKSFLKAYQETHEYQLAYKQLDEVTRTQINAFIEGKPEHHFLKQENGTSVFHLPPSPAAKHHFSDLIDKVFHYGDGVVPNGIANDVPNGLSRHARTKPNGFVKRLPTSDLPMIYEDEEQTMIMEVHEEVPFNNWALSVCNIPRYTFFPKKVLGLQNLVKYAKHNNFRVRCGGYRHSWSQSFCQNGEILVSLLNLEEVTTIPDPLPIGADYIDPHNELKVIQMASSASADEETSLVRVGVSVTNEQFRRWAVANNKWALPMDVILVE